MVVDVLGDLLAQDFLFDTQSLSRLARASIMVAPAIIEAHRKRLVQTYMKLNPAMVDRIPYLLDKYGASVQLLEELQQKVIKKYTDGQANADASKKELSVAGGEEYDAGDRALNDDAALATEMEQARIKREEMRAKIVGRRSTSAPPRLRCRPMPPDAPSVAPSTPRTVRPPADQFPPTPSPRRHWHTPSAHAHSCWYTPPEHAQSCWYQGPHAGSAESAPGTWHTPPGHAKPGWYHGRHAGSVESTPATWHTSPLHAQSWWHHGSHAGSAGSAPPIRHKESAFWTKAEEPIRMGGDVGRADGRKEKPSSEYKRQRLAAEAHLTKSQKTQRRREQRFKQEAQGRGRRCRHDKEEAGDAACG